VPESAQVVVAADVARVASSPLVRRAVETFLLKDAELASRWQRLQDSCKLDINALKYVVLAIGPSAAATAAAGSGAAGSGSGSGISIVPPPPPPGLGTGPVIMVVTGKLVETELAGCVRAMVGQGGGTLTAKTANGRTLYQAKEGNRTMFFAFGRPDTVVLGSNEGYVNEALGTGKKVAESAELASWMKLADQKAPIWAAGRVDERVRAGLVKVTNNQLSAGPAAMLLSVDPSNGAKLDIGAVMATAADAKVLESFAKTQLSLAAMAAQAKSLGKVVDKVSIETDSQVVHFRANLAMEDVNQLISALDGEGGTEQSSPPATGSGSGVSP
jgi:hypothetical protein